MGVDRAKVTDLYLRTCRDSGYGLSHIMAAQITAGVLKIHPLEVLIAVGDMRTMEKIAKGDHPACQMRENAKAS